MKAEYTKLKSSTYWKNKSCSRKTLKMQTKMDTELLICFKLAQNLLIDVHCTRKKKQNL